MEKAQQMVWPKHRSKEIFFLETHLGPGKIKFEDLNEKVEGWMELLNRYESRKDSAGNRQSIGDDMEMSIYLKECAPPKSSDISS